MGKQVLGRGKIFFDPFIDGTETLTGERYLGNTPSFSLSVETQKLDHFSSDEGVRVKDLSVTLETNFTGSLVTDEIDPENVALFFFGEAEILSQGAETGNEDVMTVQQGRYYQLGKSEALLTGKRNVTVTSVTGTGGTPTYDVTDDYTVDTELGRVYIVPGGAISDDTEVEITYNVAAYSRQQIISGSEQIYGALRFVAYNPTGDDIDYYMPKVAMSPNGEYALKGEDWQQIGLSVDVLKLGTHPNVYMDGRPYTP